MAKGRGRRPDLPYAIDANYRIYLQLQLLQTRYGKTREFVEGIFVRLFPLTTDYEFRSTYERCLRTTPEEADWKVFLSQTALKMGPFGEYVKRVGNGMENITRFDLLGDLDQLKDKLENMNINVTNELVVKLERFRVKENMKIQFTRDCLKCFNFEFHQCTAKKAKKLIDSVLHKFSGLQKSKSGETGKSKFEDFCTQLFIVPELPVSDTRPETIPGSVPTAETETQQGQEVKASHGMIDHVDSRATQLGTELRVVKGKLDDLDKENDELRLKLGVLTEDKEKKQVELMEKQQQIIVKAGELLKSKSDLVTTRKDLSVANAECARLNLELGSSHQSAYYKRMKRKEDLYQTYELFYKKHSEEGCSKSKEISDLKKKMKNLQTLIWKLKP